MTCRLMISHASTDNAAAVEMRDWLADNGWMDVFLDLDPERGISAGDRWQETLRRACTTCEAAIFLVSPAWLGSKWCLAEYLFTKSLGKRCLPVLIEPVDWDDLPVEMMAEHQIVDLVSDPEARSRLKRGLEQAGVAARSFPFPIGRRPYPGLEALTQEDAAVFFGRDAEILRALDRLRQMAETRTEKLLVLLGPSGAGKSSLLRAGLWPRLARDRRHFLPLAPIRPVRASLTGISGLWAAIESVATRDDVARHLSDDLPRTRRDIQALLSDDPPALIAFLDRLRHAAARAELCEDAPPTLVIPIDQGEELFQAEGSAEAERFLDLLGTTLRDDPHTLAVIAIRSGSYPRLQVEPRIAAELHAPFNLGPMGAEGFKEVIEGPAELVGLRVDPRLTAALIQDARGADALPLLAFTLERLYRRHGADGDLRLDEYEGLSEAITAAVDEALTDPPRALPADRVALERLMRRAFIPHLVRVDVAGKLTRRVVRKDELPEETWPLVDLLVAHRLLLTDRREAEEGEVDTVEIAHEALLREWPLLVGWLDAERDFLAWHERIGRARLAHQQGDRGLLDDRELAIAAEWLETRESDLAPADRGLIQQSQVAAAARRERERRRSRAILLSSTVAAIVFLVGALVAVCLWQRAQGARDEAQAARVQAEDARAEAEGAALRLAKINKQLRASRPLRVALTEEPVTEVGAGWYATANTFSRATARIYYKGNMLATGVILRGSAVRADWPDEPVLATAAYVLRPQNSGSAATPEVAEIEIPAVEGGVLYRLGEILWSSDDQFGATVATFESELPEDVVMVDRFADASYYESLPYESAIEPSEPPRVALSYANLGPNGLAFIISRILGRGVENKRETIYSYHGTGGGAAGAPIFDSETGDLICLHMAGSVGAKRAWCTWIGDILKEIRAPMRGGRNDLP